MFFVGEVTKNFLELAQINYQLRLLSQLVIYL